MTTPNTPITLSVSGYTTSSHSAPPSKNSSSSLISKGFTDLNGRLRSVLTNRVGLPLVLFFHRHLHSSLSGGSGDEATGSSSGVATTTTTTTARDRLGRLYSSEVARLVYDDDSALSSSTSAEIDDVLQTSYNKWKENDRTYSDRLKEWKAKKDAMKNDNNDAAADVAGTPGIPPPPDPDKPKPSNEGLFTQILSETISNELTKCGTSIAAKDQFRVVYDPMKDDSRGNAATDTTMWKVGEGTGVRTLLMVTEVGIDCDWWQKACQNVQYVEAMLQNKSASQADPMWDEATYDFSGPAMFAVLTFSPPAAKGDFEFAHLGVFLAVPSTSTGNGPKDFRLSLLFRSHPKELRALSSDWGRLIRATMILPALLEAVRCCPYESLGPNCCKIGDKVLRSYDSRFRPTLRRPDLYLQGDDLIPGHEICCFPDGDFSIDALTPPVEPVVVASSTVALSEWKRNHLFSFVGRIRIIETQFFKGKHYARSPSDIIPVVEFLQAMHGKGWVHGDIRCFNIIFGSRLIDFDFGGIVDATGKCPKYPNGYNPLLLDGIRSGKAGDDITKKNDVWDLTRAIFDLHEFITPLVNPPEGNDAAESPSPNSNALSKLPNEDDKSFVDRLVAEAFAQGVAREQRKRKAVDDLRSAIDDLKSFPKNRNDPETQLDELLAFLRNAHRTNCKVQPTSSFCQVLLDFGVSVSLTVEKDGTNEDESRRKPIKSCPAATGSPEEKR